MRIATFCKGRALSCDASAVYMMIRQATCSLPCLKAVGIVYQSLAVLRELSATETIALATLASYH